MGETRAEAPSEAREVSAKDRSEALGEARAEAPSEARSAKTQSRCGSSCAFSSTGGVEGFWEVFTGSLVSLSDQQLVYCSKQSSGCNGGLMGSAFAFYRNTALAAESLYPYIACYCSCNASFTTAIP